MIRISERQFEALAADRRHAALPAMTAYVLEAQPAWRFEKAPEEVERLAAEWLDLTARWRIGDLAHACELFDLRTRWGPFEGPDSEWIVAVLEGPLSEEEKLAFISGAMYGGA